MRQEMVRRGAQGACRHAVVRQVSAVWRRQRRVRAEEACAGRRGVEGEAGARAGARIKAWRG